MPVYDNRRAFPPLQGAFKVGQPDAGLPQSAWLKPGERPVHMSPAFRADLSRGIGEHAVRIIEQNIGAVPKRNTADPVVDPIFRYETAWGTKVPRPSYHLDITAKQGDGVPHLDNPCTVNKKFFWPSMTNEFIDGKHKRQPMAVAQPSSVRDLRSWLNLYGEPDPGKIPTGTMTTFVASRVRFGREKSKTSTMFLKADGKTWHRDYVTTMQKHYGGRFKQ
mmetsp:Transcript_46029/g.115449  ORF Transcript_46029/g.115449 Transcript_46029/m.115449 type:complete len:220 (-) Transcript_46029:6-665(-)